MLTPRAIAAGALLAGALALAGPAGAAAAPPLPDNDPFYQAPDPLPQVSSGTILRSREVSMAALGVPLPFKAWQILYTTTDTQGVPVATVTTLVLPLGTAPPGGRPLVSVQEAEDALTTRCAPSYEMRSGTDAEELEMILPLVQRGFALVVPDYEGPRSQWIAGPMAGHAVLDGVRAAERFAPGGLGPRTRVGLWGYSGGGQGTAWASELHAGYAPELNIVGVAEGGAPADIEVTARHLDGGPFSGILLLAIVGISRGYPELGLQSLLNDNGKAMVQSINNDCLNDAVRKFPFHSISEYTIDPHPFDLPQVKSVIAADNLGQRTPVAPIYMYHAINDELNPIAATDALVARYCLAGVPVQYHRDATSEHISLVASDAPAAVAYLSDRFVGKRAPSTCGT